MGADVLHQRDYNIIPDRSNHSDRIVHIIEIDIIKTNIFVQYLEIFQTKQCVELALYRRYKIVLP
jgi:hypothetical protein